MLVVSGGDGGGSSGGDGGDGGDGVGGDWLLTCRLAALCDAILDLTRRLARRTAPLSLSHQHR